MERYDEKKIIKKFPHLKGSLLSNHKANLYEQLLTSLRLLHHKTPTVRIKELISFSDVLLQKGLYKQSLNQLYKAKELAKTHHANILHLEILVLEKGIESRYITRSHQKRALELIDESKQLRTKIKNEGLWSDLALNMYDHYLKLGHIKNESDFNKISIIFNANLPNTTVGNLSFYEHIYKLQSYVWFNYITQNFASCYKNALNWVEYFEQFPEMKLNDSVLYMKGLHNCLSALFYCAEKIRFKAQLDVLEKFIQNNSSSFNENQSILAFIYLETAKLNLFFLTGEFTKGAVYTIDFEKKITRYQSQIDVHRILIFHYKIACLKFGSDDYKGSIKHLNFIINHPSLSLREDIQSFARILNLIAHYELGNDDLIEYQIKTTYKFLLKLEEMQKVQKVVFNFLKKSVHMNRNDLQPYFIDLKNNLEKILEDKYERRPTLYLDIISWLESKLTDNTVEEIIKAKRV
ncbi:MAG: hypothetical protein COB15_09285 [Flavobacteriales bacterium]|nr:MAG: hypothetical protein COB15_09285 [Flavobacteriales bacterium]